MLCAPNFGGMFVQSSHPPGFARVVCAGDQDRLFDRDGLFAGDLAVLTVFADEEWHRIARAIRSNLTLGSPYL